MWCELRCWKFFLQRAVHQHGERSEELRWLRHEVQGRPQRHLFTRGLPVAKLGWHAPCRRYRYGESMTIARPRPTLLLLIALMLSLDDCAVVGGIFKAGVWVGVIVVVLIVALLFGLVRMLGASR